MKIYCKLMFGVLESVGGFYAVCATKKKYAVPSSCPFPKKVCTLKKA
jgi:hypothetical protein